MFRVRIEVPCNKGCKSHRKINNITNCYINKFTCYTAYYNTNRFYTTIISNAKHRHLQS